MDGPVAEEHFHRGMAHDLHDRFRIETSVSEIRDGAVSRVQKDEVVDLLLSAEVSHDSVGVIELPTFLLKHQPLNARHAVLLMQEGLE